MSTTALILLAVKASLALMVLGIGLQATPRDATYLVRHPALFGRSLLAMNILMPLLALSIGVTFTLHPAVSLALVALTLSPVPPFLPNKAMKAGGDGSYMVGLFAATSVAAIVVVPLSMWILGAVFGTPLLMRPAAITKLVGASVLAPLGIGIGLRAVAPSAAARAAKPVTLIAIVVLIAALIPVLIKAWPAMRSLIGNGTLAAIVGMTLAGLGVGHLLGGPDPDDRTVLALATAARHPAVAIAILSANFPDEKLVPAAVVLALIVGAIASVPYTVWSKRRSTRAGERQRTIRIVA
jgi:BASS family bile acid:Na+ symporter